MLSLITRYPAPVRPRDALIELFTPHRPVLPVRPQTGDSGHHPLGLVR